MSGAFQTSREIFDSPIWKNITEFRIFFLIYGNAIFAEEGYQVSDDLHLERGQWLRSTRKIQEDLEFIENRQVKKYSTATINRCIKSLVNSQRLCTKTHELGTVFTVVNYELYQGFGGYKKDNLEHNLEQSRNNNETITKQRRNNNKNVKKDKNVNKVNNLKEYTPEFSEFWNVYPRKISKSVAFAKWKKVIKEESFEYLMQCTANYSKEVEMKQTEEQFIKHPATFLEKERYKDYYLLVIGGGNNEKSQGRSQGIRYGENQRKGGTLTFPDSELDELYAASEARLLNM